MSIEKSESTEIKCSLELASLEEDLTYEALSYTWGNRYDAFSMILDNRPFKITENLARALKQLHEEGNHRKIWVDAVCINQQDDAERSVQVRQMKEIYERAKSVVIWLGQEFDDSGYAMKTMNSVDRRWATRTPQPPDRRDIPAPAIDERALQAINRLLCHSWWDRVWIIQEATCANDTYLRCGGDCVEFQAAVATVNFISHHIIQQSFQQDFKAPDIRHLQRVISLDRVRCTRRLLGFDPDLLSLLDNSRTCEASDPRDKVFALSGLATGAQREAGNPDYSISIDKAYIRFAYAIVKLDQDLDILGHCQVGVRNLRSWSSFKFIPSSMIPKKTLPNWTPDWTMWQETTPFLKREMPNKDSSARVYNASDEYFPSVRLAEDFRTLFVRGSVVDTVSKLGEALGPELNPSTIRLWHSWTETELGSIYLNNETTHEAFLRTIVTDIRVVNGRCLRGSAAPWPIRNKQDDTSSFISSSLLSQELHSRGIFLSKQGYMGLARYDVREGDKICLLHGGQVLFILRPVEENHVFKGECHVHGLMDGEGMRYPRVWQDFALC